MWRRLSVRNVCINCQLRTTHTLLTSIFSSVHRSAHRTTDDKLGTSDVANITTWVRRALRMLMHGDTCLRWRLNIGGMTHFASWKILGGSWKMLPRGASWDTSKCTCGPPLGELFCSAPPDPLAAFGEGNRDEEWKGLKMEREWKEWKERKGTEREKGERGM